MALRNSETSATLCAIAVTISEFTDTFSEFNVTFAESGVTKFSSFPSFIDFFGGQGDDPDSLHRYMAGRDQGGVADSPKMPGLRDPVDSRLGC